ncbi:MAG: zinc-dependent metalloprotease, partial [Acidobacteriota bacterium]|nr:zinc-dependent metalloprotease [Acidobacteriota bacterium]
YTGTHGVAVSVMDYNPVNVSSDPKKQGHFWNKVVGDYDIWAIEYAYSEGNEAMDAEMARLASIAKRAPEPLLAYGTDEDARFGSFAVDPRTNTWDLGSDPLAYAKERSALVARVQPDLERRLIREGDGYQRLRAAYGSLLFERSRSIFPALRTIGGLYMVRDHKGDPGARPPFMPIPAERQREALSLVVEQALSEGAWTFDAETLNKLQPDRWSHWGRSRSPDPTFPVHAFVASTQATIVSQLLDPVRLSRMLDNELRVRSGREVFTMAEMFEALDGAIWSELGALDSRASSGVRSINSFRRSLQRIHVDRLTAMLLRTASGPRQIPEDARSLARWSLTRLSRRLTSLMPDAGADTATRAHLLETAARIERALDASISLSVGSRRP